MNYLANVLIYAHILFIQVESVPSTWMTLEAEGLPGAQCSPLKASEFLTGHLELSIPGGFK